jgi:6-pyruvoyltetrahydropterin/6-carboxytetrahydropterin synthase
MSLDGVRFRISRAVTFEAAHYMGTKPQGHPYRSIHGHSFRIEASVAGRVRPGEEWVEDYSALASALEEVAGHLDHRLLNEIQGLETPTLERIAMWAARQLRTRLPGLVAVTLERPSLSERCTLELD